MLYEKNPARLPVTPVHATCNVLTSLHGSLLRIFPALRISPFVPSLSAPRVNWDSVIASFTTAPYIESNSAACLARSGDTDYLGSDPTCTSHIRSSPTSDLLPRPRAPRASRKEGRKEGRSHLSETARTIVRSFQPASHESLICRGLILAV